ncbi:MAG: hypothetical protein EA421_12590 [Gemmatimonadales bacterium]|nr:MAG: hypothetical protein EA421_12590 [Gemmatimonadales bacterium]
MRHWFVPVILAALLLSACDTAPEDRARPAGAETDDPPSPLLVEHATAVISGRLFLSAEGEVLEEGVVVLAGDRVAGAGVDLVKLYEQLPPDAFRAAVDAARELGLPVATDLGMALTRGLSGAEVDIVDAAEAGVTTIEHLSGLALAYQRRGGDPFAETVDEEIIHEIAEALTASGVAFVPTVATGLRMEDESLFRAEGLPGVDRMAPVFRGQWDRIRAGEEQWREAVEADGRLVRALLSRLVAGGSRVGAGSDLPASPGMYPGWALHQELEALVHLGMTPMEALRAATVVAAELAGRDDIGELSAGARADLVVVAGDPTLEITDSRRIEAVWFGGEPVDLDLAWERVAEAIEAAAAAFGG